MSVLRPTPLLVLALAACKPSAPDGVTDTGPLSIAVTSYPLQCFAEAIGGDAVEVSFPAPRNIDPAYWKLDVEDVAELQEADLVVRNGAGHERWVDQITLSADRVIDTTAGMADSLISLPDAITHNHGPEGEHSHVGHASTTWLDPLLARDQARAIHAALVARRPDDREHFDEGLAALESRLDALHATLQATVALSPRPPLLASHPVYQYLARRYDLNLVSLHWEPDAMPPDEEWNELASTRTEHPAQWILWEAEPDATIAAKLTELGVSSLVFSPCSNVPPQGDYFTVQEQNAARLRSAFTAE